MLPGRNANGTCYRRIIQSGIFQSVQLHWCVAASCHLSLRACNRSLFARGLSIDSRAYVIGLHPCWPIRAPLPTRANQDACLVITPKRSKANSTHTAAWHAWTRTPARNIVQKATLFLTHFSVFGHGAILIWRDRDMTVRKTNYKWINQMVHILSDSLIELSSKLLTGNNNAIS